MRCTTSNTRCAIVYPQDEHRFLLLPKDKGFKNFGLHFLQGNPDLVKVAHEKSGYDRDMLLLLHESRGLLNPQDKKAWSKTLSDLWIHPHYDNRTIEISIQRGKAPECAICFIERKLTSVLLVEQRVNSVSHLFQNEEEGR